MDSDNDDETFTSLHSTRSEWQAEQQVGGAYSETTLLRLPLATSSEGCNRMSNASPSIHTLFAEAIDCLKHIWYIAHHATAPCLQALRLFRM